MTDLADDPVAHRIARDLADRYRIERELGRGGMATVFLAEDLRHERPVAIKVLHPELGAWLGAERFLAEIRITAKLQHPHILPLLDSGRASATSSTDEGLLYYVMPYVAGETLRARLRREQQFPVAEAVRIAREIASALACAHAAGIVHRDIKPENILLGPPNATSPAPSLLSDFGIARSLDASADRLTGTGMTIGTPAYMSPEQATGEREIDARSDIYSLGCVIYEMLAGEPPFSGPNPRVILAKQLSDPVRPVRRLRETVPQHIDDALAVALSRSAVDRFSDVASFSAALDGPASLHRDDAVRTTDGATVRVPSRRRRVRFAAATVIMLAAAVAGWAMRPRQAAALGVPSVRIQRFRTALGDTASAYLASTLQQDVQDALARSRAARVFVTDSTHLDSGYAVSATAARVGDSVEVNLLITTEPTGEFKGQRVVRRPLGHVHEVPELVTDAILAIVGRPRAATRSGRAPTTDSLAYDFYLRGRDQIDRRTELSTQRAVAFLRAAVQRDSGFAEGWAGLARALQRANLRGYRIPDLPADRVQTMMIEASDRALEADSTRSSVWIARGLIFGDLEPSSRRNMLLAYQKAIALDSNDADAWHYAAVAWDDSLEPARAVESWRRVLRIAPTHRQALGFLSQHYLWMRQPDSSIFWADSAVRIDPANYFAREMLALGQLLGGDTVRAAENFRSAIRLGKGPDEVVGWVGLTDIALADRNRRAADTLFARALALVDTLHPPVHDAVYIAAGYAAFGDSARAIQLLQRYDPRADSHFQMHLHCDPGLDPLRAMSTFRALLVRLTDVCPVPG